VLEGISVVATDLDGTLLSSEGRISDGTRSALSRAAEAGIVVVVVTARPFWALKELDLRHVHGLAICTNGALIADLETDEIVSSSVLQHDDAQTIATKLRALLPGLAFAVETHDYYGRESHYVNNWPPPPGSPIDTLDRLTTSGVLKLLGRHADIRVDRLQEIGEIIGASASVTCSEGDGLMEFGPPGVSKGSGIREVAARLGKASTDVLAIGDMPNDLPMLSWARVAAAVANAHPSVLEAADVVVPSNDEDGVGYLLDAIIQAKTAST